MMKEICAQCLQPQRDPATGKLSYVFSCFNQDQPLDRVDFPGLARASRRTRCRRSSRRSGSRIASTGALALSDSHTGAIREDAEAESRSA